MHSIFEIPATPEAADALLGELGELATAVGWKRGVTIYARVRPTGTPDAGDGREAPSRFAKRGLIGLRSTRAIDNHVRAVQKAVDEGILEPPKLGATVVLPEADWDDYIVEPDATADWRVGGPEMAGEYAKEASEAGTTVGMAIRAGQNKAALTAAILADPAVRLAAREAIATADRRGKPIIDSTPEPDQFTRVVLAMTGAKRTLTDALGAVVNLNGIQAQQKRRVVADLVGEIRMVLDAIEGAARGESLDEGLERLLAEGGAQ